MRGRKGKEEGSRSRSLFPHVHIEHGEDGHVRNVVAATDEIHGSRQLRNVLRAVKRSPVVNGLYGKRNVAGGVRHEREHFHGMPSGQKRGMFFMQTGQNVGERFSVIATGELTDREVAEYALNPREPGLTDIQVAFDHDPQLTIRTLKKRKIPIPDELFE